MQTIFEDLSAGESPVRLVELPGESYMPRRGGKKLHKSIPFRWASSGKAGHRLETIRTPTGVSTTRSAVLRYFAALTDPAPARPAGRTPARRDRDVSRAEAELAAAGIF